MGGISNIIDKAESLPGGQWADPIKAFTGVDLIGDLSGKPQQEAAAEASKLQYQATLAGIEAQKEALAQQRGDLAPFRNMANADVIQKFRRNAFANEDYSYNPRYDGLLNNALNRATRSVMDAQAAKGKLGSGSTLTSLTEAMAPIYMNREQQVFENRYNANNQQFNQLQNIVGMAQNAAAGQGAATANTTNNITDLRTQGANAQAAGQIGAANAQAQGTQNLMGLAALAASFFSDERLKEDVKRVGKMNDGTPIYTYKYKQGDGKTHMGVMAQEARKKHPDAVRKDPLTNMLMVNYSRL